MINTTKQVSYDRDILKLTQTRDWVGVSQLYMFKVPIPNNKYIYQDIIQYGDKTIYQTLGFKTIKQYAQTIDLIPSETKPQPWIHYETVESLIAFEHRLQNMEKKYPRKFRKIVMEYPKFTPMREVFRKIVAIWRNELGMRDHEKIQNVQFWRQNKSLFLQNAHYKLLFEFLKMLDDTKHDSVKKTYYFEILYDCYTNPGFFQKVLFEFDDLWKLFENMSPVTGFTINNLTDCYNQDGEKYGRILRILYQFSRCYIEETHQKLASFGSTMEQIHQIKEIKKQSIEKDEKIEQLEQQVGELTRALTRSSHMLQLLPNPSGINIDGSISPANDHMHDKSKSMNQFPMNKTVFSGGTSLSLGRIELINLMKQASSAGNSTHSRYSSTAPIETDIRNNIFGVNHNNYNYNGNTNKKSSKNSNATQNGLTGTSGGLTGSSDMIRRYNTCTGSKASTPNLLGPKFPFSSSSNVHTSDTTQDELFHQGQAGSNDKILIGHNIHDNVKLIDPTELQTTCAPLVGAKSLSPESVAFNSNGRDSNGAPTSSLIDIGQNWTQEEVSDWLRQQLYNYNNQLQSVIVNKNSHINLKENGKNDSKSDIKLTASNFDEYKNNYDHSVDAIEMSSISNEAIKDAVEKFRQYYTRGYNLFGLNENFLNKLEITDKNIQQVILHVTKQWLETQQQNLSQKQKYQINCEIENYKQITLNDIDNFETIKDFIKKQRRKRNHARSAKSRHHRDPKFDHDQEKSKPRGKRKDKRKSTNGNRNDKNTQKRMKQSRKSRYRNENSSARQESDIDDNHVIDTSDSYGSRSRSSSLHTSRNQNINQDNRRADERARRHGHRGRGRDGRNGRGKRSKLANATSKSISTSKSPNIPKQLNLSLIGGMSMPQPEQKRGLSFETGDQDHDHDEMKQIASINSQVVNDNENKNDDDGKDEKNQDLHDRKAVDARRQKSGQFDIFEKHPFARTRMLYAQAYSASGSASTSMSTTLDNNNNNNNNSNGNSFTHAGWTTKAIQFFQRNSSVRSVPSVQSMKSISQSGSHHGHGARQSISQSNNTHVHVNNSNEQITHMNTYSSSFSAQHAQNTSNVATFNIAIERNSTKNNNQNTSNNNNNSSNNMNNTNHDNNSKNKDSDNNNDNIDQITPTLSITSLNDIETPDYVPMPSVAEFITDRDENAGNGDIKVDSNMGKYNGKSGNNNNNNNNGNHNVNNFAQIAIITPMSHDQLQYPSGDDILATPNSLIHEHNACGENDHNYQNINMNGENDHESRVSGWGMLNSPTFNYSHYNSSQDNVFETEEKNNTVHVNRKNNKNEYDYSAVASMSRSPMESND